MKQLISCIWLMIFLYSSTAAQLNLPKLISDGMVLQRDALIPIHGQDKPGQNITIEFINKKYRTQAGTDGKWNVQIGPLNSGGPYTMQIRGSNNILLRDVYIGDVYLCSGQSNMVHSLALHKDRYKNEIAGAKYPQIRNFTVPLQADLLNEKTVLSGGKWLAANPENVLQFSVVAYFFAKEIHEQNKIPIGIINASVGGTPIESWMSAAALKDFPSTYKIMERNKDTAYVNSVNRMAAIKNNLRPVEEDEGTKNNWSAIETDENNWKTFLLPGYWEDQGFRSLNGIVWFRKEIDLSANFESKPVRLSLGRMVDADKVFINGKLVGQTTYQYPQRRYDIPEGILQAGENVIAVRITNYSSKGGFVPDKPYYLATVNDTIRLEGAWKFKIGDVFENDMSWNPGINLQNQPTALFNGMIHPLTSFPVKGILWYQGESNTNNAFQYGTLLKSLIKDWRKQWQKDLPFLFVQMPNYGEVSYTSHSSWARLRQEQLKTLEVPHTAMAISIDLGEWNDIHPGNKKDVGQRLALAARQLIYHEKNLVHSGPIVLAAKQKGNQVVLEFDHTGGGLITNDGKEPGWFFMAAADKQFLPAKTKIHGNTVIAYNETIRHPVFIRYAWADNPDGANLYNKEGLPASPFEIRIQPAIQTSNENPWNNKKAAVVLTYDDGLNVHLSNVIPALDAAGLKGTFYISDYFGGLQSQIPGWKMAAANGHELGNHTIFHPCLGNLPGREWVNPDYDLSKYSFKRITDEIKAMNNILFAIDGKQERTFAFPCNDTKINDSSYFTPLQPGFLAARAVRHELISLQDAMLFDLPSYTANGENGSHMIELVKKAIEEKKLLVFVFHGVGGEHQLNVSLEVHNQLLSFLQQNQDEIWIATMTEVARFIRNNKNSNSN